MVLRLRWQNPKPLLAVHTSKHMTPCLITEELIVLEFVYDCANVYIIFFTVQKCYVSSRCLSALISD